MTAIWGTQLLTIIWASSWCGSQLYLPNLLSIGSSNKHSVSLFIFSPINWGSDIKDDNYISKNLYSRKYSYFFWLFSFCLMANSSVLPILLTFYWTIPVFTFFLEEYYADWMCDTRFLGYCTQSTSFLSFQSFPHLTQTTITLRILFSCLCAIITCSIDTMCVKLPRCPPPRTCRYNY